jgi:hypothetical protein
MKRILVYYCASLVGLASPAAALTNKEANDIKELLLQGPLSALTMNCPERATRSCPSTSK